MILAGLAVVVIGILVVVLLVPRGVPGGDSSTDEPVSFPDAASPAPLDVTGAIDPEWIADISDATGIPAVPLAAYVRAIAGAEVNFPGCTLSWNTLAAIGAIESDHGRHDGASSDDHGNVTPQIFGVPLTGGDVENIPDTDGGEFDQTSEFDRAIGPMQLIPSTWQSWAIDGNNDAVPDPHNIFDATLAAADYLCFHNPDWTTPEDWAAGIGWYNSATGYATNVATEAQRYADAASALG